MPSAQSSSRLSPGMTIERYQIQRLIGSGGMGAVYLAVHTVLGSRHAIKVLLSDAHGASSRLLQEARAQAHLQHPNILPVTDILSIPSGSALVMEYVPDGLNLSHTIRQRALSQEAVDRLGRGIIAGIKAAHRHRLLHRDIKPANILVRNVDGVLEAAVTDFGLVQSMDADPEQRLTKRRLLMGTPGYASPEQLRGHRQLDVRTDVFALGATLYELVTGRPAFQGDSILERCNQTCAGEFTPSATLRPDLPQRMHDAIRGALVVDRARRIGSAAELLAVWSGKSPHDVESHLWEGEHPELDLLLQRPNAPRLQAHLQRCVHCRVMLKAYQCHVAADATGPGNETFPEEPEAAIIGRDAALSFLHARLIQDRARILTIKGTGGVGKTCLARHVAALHRRSFEGGTFFCDLSSAQDRGDITRLVRDVLSVAKVLDDGVRQLGLALSSYGRCLVILDNAEHLVPHVQALLQAWLPLAPLVTWLTTSRSQLHLPQEVVFTLEPMRDEEAVAFFEHCMVRALGTAEVPQHPREQVLSLVRTLDGLPLAIEMAAARLQVFSLPQLQRRLSDRFRVLRNPFTSSNRHATMQATIDWSWSLLSPPAQHVLAQSSLFRSGFDLDALEAVAVMPDTPEPLWIEDILQQLINNSMVQVVDSNRAPRRFTLLESVRAYARTKLQQRDPSQEAVQRYINHYAGMLVLEPEPALDGMTNAPMSHVWHQRRNLTIATKWALDAGQFAAATRCFVRLCNSQDEPMRNPDVVSLLQRISVNAVPPGKLQLMFQHIWSRWLLSQGQLDEALSLLTTLQQQCSESGSPAYLPRLLISIARIYVRQGRLEDAERTFHEALRLDQARGARGREAGVHNILGSFYCRQRRLDEAISHLETALALSRATGLVRSEMISQTWMGVVLVHQRAPDRALHHMEQAVVLSRREGTAYGEARSLYTLGRFHGKQGNYVQSRQCLERALLIYERLGDEALSKETRRSLVALTQKENAPAVPDGSESS